ncbi:hypothetical protein ACWCRF_20845, partial [Streptomyces sp. NPDC002405]
MPKKGNNSLKQKARRLAHHENIPYSEALARLMASQPAPDSTPRTGDSTFATEDFQGAIIRSLQPSLDLQQMLAESMRPKLDLQQMLAESMRPSLDLQQMLAESMRP